MYLYILLLVKIGIKVWDWIKIYVNFTNKDDNSHQIGSQFRASSRNSEDCDTDDNDSSTPRDHCDAGHFLGKEACYNNDRHCDDEEEESEIYFFSDSESEGEIASHSDCDGDCESHEESRWEETWAASPSGFSDLKCQQRETLSDHLKHFPQNGPGQNNFVSENIFQKEEKIFESKPPIERWFDSHLFFLFFEGPTMFIEVHAYLNKARRPIDQ